MTTEVAKAKSIKNQNTAVARAAKIMAEYPMISNIEVVPSGDASIVTFDLAVDIPSKTKAAGITKSGVKSVEPIYMTFPKDYPELAPVVSLREDFPIETPHFTPGNDDLRPRPCLVQEVMDEYHMAVGLPGVLNQLIVWMDKAAKGKLVDNTSGWEPTYRIASDHRIFLDSQALVRLAEGDSGSRLLAAPYFEKQKTPIGRYSLIQTPVDEIDGATVIQTMSEDEVLRDKDFNGSLGGVYWVPQESESELVTVNRHFPENISDHVALQERITEMGAGTKDCIFVLLQTVSGMLDQADYRQWRANGTTVPVPVFILVQRPHPIIGSKSNIEILSYIIEYPFGCKPEKLMTGDRLAVVATARNLPLFSRELLSRMDDYKNTANISVIGAGSVGSKIATSVARSGWNVKAICDHAMMLPHNYARHAVQNYTQMRAPKAMLLAEIVGGLGSNPEVEMESVIDIVGKCIEEGESLGWGADYIVHSTASNRVRLAFSRIPFVQQEGTLVDAGLLKQGKVARLLIEGPQKNPNFHDLEALFYQRASTTGLARRLETGSPDLVPVDVGFGCGSVTMKMSDARLSSMTALITEELMEYHSQYGSKPDDRPALIAVWEKDDRTGTTKFRRHSVDPFVVVQIDGSDWTVRVAPNVINTIERDRVKYKAVETGGVLMGRYNELLKTITIVDTLEAPPDSTRSATLFSLGTEGGSESAKEYYKASGQSLMDMGTWHTHLANTPPSPRDKKTAGELMDEKRAHPFVLLIHSPTNIYAVLADPNDKKHRPNNDS